MKPPPMKFTLKGKAHEDDVVDYHFFMVTQNEKGTFDVSYNGTAAPGGSFETRDQANERLVEAMTTVAEIAKDPEEFASKLIRDMISGLEGEAPDKPRRAAVDEAVSEFEASTKIKAQARSVHPALATFSTAMIDERERAGEFWGEEFDSKNTPNDWVAYIARYLGQSVTMPFDRLKFEANLIKVAALCAAAHEWCERTNGEMAKRHYD